MFRFLSFHYHLDILIPHYRPYRHIGTASALLFTLALRTWRNECSTSFEPWEPEGLVQTSQDPRRVIGRSILCVTIHGEAQQRLVCFDIWTICISKLAIPTEILLGRGYTVTVLVETPKCLAVSLQTVTIHLIYVTFLVSNDSFCGLNHPSG